CAGRLSRGTHGARQGLRIRRRFGRQAFQLQERAERLRPLPARRSGRPAEGDLRRADELGILEEAGSLSLAAYFAREIIILAACFQNANRVDLHCCAARKLARAYGQQKPGRTEMKMHRRSVLKGALAATVATSALKVPAAVAQAGPIKLGFLTIKTGP